MTEASRNPALIVLLDKVLLILALIGGGATLAFMVFVSTFNVLIMRKALNSPIMGAEDLMILSLVILVAFAIPFGGRTGAHIEIEIFESRMSPGFAKWSMVVLRILAGGLMVIMANQLIHAGKNAPKFGETTQQLLISFEPFYYLLSLSVGIYALVLVSDAYQLLKFGNIQQISLGEDQ